MTTPEISIPAAENESLLWTPSNRDFYSRSEIRRQSGRYESTIPAALADWRPTLPGDISAEVEDATRALVKFDQYAMHVLGADSAASGPMSAILLRTESASSSQIEHLTTSARQLALAELDEGDAPNARTVVGNVRAMEAAVALSAEVSLETVLAMHRELLSHQRGMEPHAGVLREVLVWLGRGSAGPLLADFVGPQAERVLPALEDLFAFARRDDLPVLVQIAVAHAQFETIHPFVDGNGRTGRALVQAMLRNKGVSVRSTAPISAGLLTDTERYFAALSAFRLGDAGPIVRRFAQAALYAAASGGQLIDALAAELGRSREKLAGVRPQAAAWAILPRLVGQPIVNAKYLKSALGMNGVTAARALDLLVDRGVLVERTGKRRNRVWQHAGILAALDEFAAGIGRPPSR